MPKWYEKVGGELSRIGKEVGKGASVAMREAGKGAKVIGSEVRKTVGVGVGDITIELGAIEHKLGETIEGTLKLDLKEATAAKRLVIGLRGTRRRIKYSKTSSGGSTQQSHKETVHQFEIELGKNQEYETSDFEFRLPIPSEVAQEPEITSDGVIGDVARVVKAVSTGSSTPVAWSVYAFLDIPWKRNVSASMDVAIR